MRVVGTAVVVEPRGTCQEASSSEEYTLVSFQVFLLPTSVTIAVMGSSGGEAGNKIHSTWM